MASPALNPLVSELDNLSPQAKQAIVGAHQGLVGQMQAPAPAQQPQAQPAPVQHLQPPSQVPTLGPAPIDVSGNKREYSRLTAPATPGVHDHTQTGLPGDDQIHNPWARIPIQIADAIGSTFAPRLMTVLPGTQLHHNMLVGQQQAAIGEGENEANEAQKRGLEAAQTTNQNMMPELNAAKAENAVLKTEETVRHNGATEGTNNRKVDTGLAAHGLRPNVDGTPGYELDPTTPVGQKTLAQNDYIAAQKGLAEARTEVEHAKNDPNSPAYKLALQRLSMEQAKLRIAEQNVGIRQLEYNGNYLGTGANGEALPGAPAGVDGKPIGLKTAGLTKPTTAARGRGEQGQAIITAGENLKKDIAANRDLFGNIGSYWKQMTNGSPIADPRAAKIMSEIASYAALQPAMHGMRGGQIMHEFEKMVGGIPKNADALMAAIDGIGGTAGVMRDIGTMRTVAPGGAQPHQGPQVGAVEGGYRFKGGDPSKQTSWEKVQ